MKHSFLRLISSFYILLISALMIVISAYAWMVISDSPAAGGIGFGVAGLDAWNIPEYTEPDTYDYMDGTFLSIEDVETDDNGVYLIDSAEAFVAVMQYVNGNSDFRGPLTMRLQKHISLQDHQMQSVTDENNATVEQFWNADDWESVEVEGYTGTGVITIEVDPALTQGTEFTTAYIKGLAKPLFAGGFAGSSGIVISDVTIFDSDIMSNSTLGSGAFIECVDAMQTISLTNCHLINSSIDEAREDLNYSRVGGLIGWTSGYDVLTDGPVKTYVDIKECSVIGCTLRGTSVGGIIGHAGANAWTFTTIENCTVMSNELLSVDPDGWRVGEIVGTANIGEVTIIDAVTDSNMRAQRNKTAPNDRPSLYGRIVLGETGKIVIVDNLNGLAYVAGGFISDAASAMIVDDQNWMIHGSVMLTDEFSFCGKNISVQPYRDSIASITFKSTASGASYPGTEYASAGFNFIEMDGYTGTEDEIRAEKGSEINFNQIKFINNKTYGTDCTTKSRRHSYCMYALAESATYTDCTFEGSLVVYNSAEFYRCTFTESVDNRYCLFLDDVYDAEWGEYLIQDCTFTAASTAYGCVKVSEDASLTAGKDTGAKFMLKNSTFNNETHKSAVYINGYVTVITDGDNKFTSVTGGILAKNIGTEPSSQVTYQIADGTPTACLTVDEYQAARELEDKTRLNAYDETEFGNNAGNPQTNSEQSMLNGSENGDETTTTVEGETTETVEGESTTTVEGETTTTVSSEAASVSETTTAASTVTDEATPNVESQPTETTTTETTTTETTTTETTTIETTAESADNSLEANASEMPESEETASENAGSEENAGESADGNAESSEEETTSSETASEENTSEASSEENVA